MKAFHRIATAFLVTCILLAGCAGTSVNGGATGSVPRCVGQANADCYGGPP